MYKVYSISALSFAKEKAFNIKIQGVKLGKGNGNVLITGNLGNVAHEAMTLAKTLLGLRNPVFYKTDYHLHFEYPSLKKEGPSWGVACYILLFCLINEDKYIKGIAATGELDLEGNVKIVKYLDEKIKAWAKSSCSYLILPKFEYENIKDSINTNIYQISNINEITNILRKIE